MASLFYVLFIYLFSFDLVVTENCPLITDIELNTDIRNVRFTGEGTPPPIVLMNWTVNCQVVGTVKGTMKFLSITVKYDIPTLNKVETSRITLDCVTGGGQFDWDPVNDITVLPSSDQNHIDALLNGDTLSNCSSCKGSGVNGNHECVACDSSCGVGFDYCTGSTASDCCNFYDENVCVVNCPENHLSNSSYDCICEDFYQETQCTVCTLQQSDCQNGGTSDTVTCACICDGTGYADRLCTADIDECDIGTYCIVDNTVSCDNTIGAYTCNCVNGFNGNNCQNNINDCEDDSCSFVGTCSDGVASFTCTCAPGYTGETCTIDINECADNPCQNEGTCVDQVNGYRCNCVEQYEGTDCEIDVNECETQSPCLNEGVCQNHDGGYSCDCVGQWTNPTCDVCEIENCVTTDCDGPRYQCVDCINRYTPVSTDQSSCVLCTIGNCTSCRATNTCVSCAHNLVTNGTICQPRPDNRQIGVLDYGSFFGIIISLIVIIAIVIVIIVIVAVISLKIRAQKPIQYGAKEKVELTEPIVLKLQSQI